MSVWGTLARSATRRAVLGVTATVEWKAQRIDNIAVSQEHLQPIRFQGQHFDEEIGLHYNRFRYFDPDMGMFTTRDPIGLLGGTNVFQYAPNPTGWIDPFGLSRMPTWMPTRQGYQRQHLIPYSSRNHSMFQRSSRSMNNATNMMYLPVTTGIDSNPNKGLHRGWTTEHRDYNNKVNSMLDRLERQASRHNWSDKKISEKVKDLQNKLRKGFHSGKYTCASPVSRK